MKKIPLNSFVISVKQNVGLLSIFQQNSTVPGTTIDWSTLCKTKNCSDEGKLKTEY